MLIQKVNFIQVRIPMSWNNPYSELLGYKKPYGILDVFNDEVIIVDGE